MASHPWIHGRTSRGDRLDRIESEATKRIQEGIKQGQNAAKEIEEQARARAMEIVEKARDETNRVVEKAKLDLKDYIVDVGVQAGRKAAIETLDAASHKRLVERLVEEMTNVR